MTPSCELPIVGARLTALRDAPLTCGQVTWIAEHWTDRGRRFLRLESIDNCSYVGKLDGFVVGAALGGSDESFIDVTART